MEDFQFVREIETDLRSIIAEAAARKTIPHIKDRAERAISSVQAVVDSATLDVAMNEVLSTLLITTETGSIPRLILLSLSILQKLAPCNVVSSETFLHMVTVLCKATYSVTGVVPGANGGPTQVEIETAQLRCLQTLHLLQVEKLSEYFLNEIALSQIISLCTTLSVHPSSSAVLSQASGAALAQLQMFVAETTFLRICASKPDVIPPITPPASACINTHGELTGVAHPSLSALDPELRPLFLFVHDLVTMSAPQLTRQVFCHLFGATRLPANVALEILLDFFTLSAERYCFWTKASPFLLLLTHYLLPVISKSLTAVLSDSAGRPLISTADLTHVRLLLRLFVRLSRHSTLFPFIDQELNRVFVLLQNFLVDESLRPLERVLVTETATMSVAGNRLVVLRETAGEGMVGRRTESAPFGADSPVNRPGTAATSTFQSIVESVCAAVCHEPAQNVQNLNKAGVKSINDGTGPNVFSVLNSTAGATDLCEYIQAVPQVVPATSLDLILAFVDIVYKATVDDPTTAAAQVIESTWSPILSSLIFVLSTSHDPSSTCPGVVVGLEKLVFTLALADLKTGLSSSITAILQLKPPMNKFQLNLFHRLGNNPVTLEHIPTDLWRLAIRQFEIIAASSQPGTVEDTTVQGIAMDAFFSTPQSEGAVRKLTEALLGMGGGMKSVSVWMMEKLSQLLRSEFAGPQLESLWSELVSPLLAQSEAGQTIPPSVNDAVVAMVLAVSETAPSEVCPVILSSLIPQFATASPVRTLEGLLALVQARGHLLSTQGWTAALAVVHAVVSRSALPAGFAICELLLDEFVDKIGVANTCTALGLVQSLAVASSALPITCAFRAIALALKVSEHLPRDEQVGWEAVGSFFRFATAESRADVRNCALRTLASVNFPNNDLLEIVAAIVLKAVGVADSPAATPAPPVGMIIHHSRDTERKRWSESLVLALQAADNQGKEEVAGTSEGLLSEIFSAVFPADPDEGFAETIGAGSAFFINQWRQRHFNPDPVFLAVLRAEQARTRTIAEVPRTTAAVLPALMLAAGKAAEPIPPVSGQEIFELFALTISHPAVYLVNATPFPAPGAGPADDEYWGRWGSHQYEKEVEPFTPVVAYAESMYVATSDSVRLRNAELLSSLMGGLFLLEEERLLPLLLRADVVLRNSLSLAVGLRGIDFFMGHATSLSPQSRLVLVELLAQLSLTRRASVGVAATGLWKLATQALVVLSDVCGIPVQRALMRSLTSAPLPHDITAEPLDFTALLVTLRVSREWESDPVFTAWIFSQLATAASSLSGLFLFYIMVAAAVVDRQEDHKQLNAVSLMELGRILATAAEPAEWPALTYKVVPSCESDALVEKLVPVLASVVGEVCGNPEKFESVISAVLMCMRTAGDKHRVRTLVTTAWADIAGTLVRDGTHKTRHLLADLLVHLEEKG